MASEPTYSAREAAAALGVSVPTLYAYVSRGLIRSQAGGPQDGARARRYHADDVRRLQERKEQRRDPGRAAAEALHWGSPVLESSITLPAAHTFYYRGHDALQLARDRSVEEVAALIWVDDLDAGQALFTAPTAPLPPRAAVVARECTGLETADRFAVVLPLAAAGDPSAYDLRPIAVPHTGARILQLLTTIAVGEQPMAGGIAEALAHGWTPGDPHADGLFRAALVLCADQELNVTSFAARCVASAAATPYAVVSAGLAALGGAKHAGRGARILALLREAGSADRARAVVAERLRRGEPVPGFGHALFPEGDPRGKMLLELTAQARPDCEAVTRSLAVAAAAWELLHERPDVEFGLVTLAEALQLPPGGANALFALSRTIGWIGHAMEEYQVDRMIRPRARYVGERPTGREASG
ncbi:MAG TPA: citrate synthase family protein [Chloroflexota bacterium]|nr:citrate synthase family protein [Chloroflexota bacterium]